MKLLRKDRGQGKTTELVKQSNKEWKYIVCMNDKRVEVIVETANKLGLDIPYPVTIKELPFRSRYVKSVLVDVIDDILEYIVGKPVNYATTSCEIVEEINNDKTDIYEKEFNQESIDIEKTFEHLKFKFE